MRLVWTAGARRELGEIVADIWFDNPAAAKELRKRIERAAALLKLRPFLGRPGMIADTREAIPHPSYRIVYQVVGNTVSILTVIHTRRQWPPMPEGGS